MNNMGINPYATGMVGRKMPSQTGHNEDMTMSGMLDESMMNDFDNMPNMGLDMGNMSEGSMQNSFPPGQSLMPSNGNGLTDDGGNLPSQALVSGVGAGPLPAGFGTQTVTGGSSTLTEFTKRRNWPQKVIEELKDFLHILTPNGRMIFLSPSIKALTGYGPEELMNTFIVDYIHPDDSAIFVKEFNESIASGNAMRLFYRFRKKDGAFTIFETHGHPHLASGASYGRDDGADYCRGFFMMARPYPAKNAALLDSFLEHKIENERLTKRINDLKQEEADDADEATKQWARKHESVGAATSEGTGTTVVTGSTAKPLCADTLAMPPPAKPTPSNAALTRQNLESRDAISKPDSINDKMARFSGATRGETIEMLTGLRYQEGERSQGISTGDISPALIRGDAGIAIPADKDGRGDKKKKIKLPDEFVCTDCGTLDSPEWRKGPSGPKTLCNACGLRWAKKEKKRGPPGHEGSSLNGHPTTPAPGS